MIDPSTRERLQQNWSAVENDVSEAATQSGRTPDEVRIVGVSKYVGVELTQGLIDAGCHDLGESRPQQLWQKAEALAEHEKVRWHLIGHLQRNKVRRILRCQPLIHSIDSDRLLNALAMESVEQGQTARVFLEINISGEEAKTGLSAQQATELIQQIPTSGVQVEGLMAMAGWGTDRSEARRQFSQLRELRDKLASDSGLPLPELSMGMSGDFHEAIAEGATIVRIGSRLFEGVERY